MAITVLEQQDAMSNSVALGFTLAAGSAVGDLLMLIQTNNFYTLANLTTPTGTAASTWTLQGSMDLGSNTFHAKVWTAPVTTGGAQTVTVNSTTSDEERYAGVWRFPSGTTFDVAAFVPSVQATSTSHVAPAVTTTGTDDHLVCLFESANGDTNYTAFTGSLTGYTERDIAGFVTARAAAEQLVAAGATGTRTATSANSRTYVALSVAVKSSAVASGARVPRRRPALNGLIVR